jgi:hypothetical protein
VKEVLQLVRESIADVKKMQFGNLVDRKLNESKLGAPAQKLVREHLADRVVTEAEVDAEIVRVREAFAATLQPAASSAQRSSDSTRTDKVQLALDQMLGVKESMGKGVKAFRGVREAYQFITGDRELRFGSGGGWLPAVSEAIATARLPEPAVELDDEALGPGLCRSRHGRAGAAGLDRKPDRRLQDAAPDAHGLPRRSSDRCGSRRLRRADEADGRPDPVRRAEARRIAHDLGRDHPQR